ncbi:MAG: hypothetical protein ACI8ZM_005195, partial [Crocinitomix sp.]
MKVNTFKIIFIVIITFGILTISCQQEKLQSTDSQVSIAENDSLLDSKDDSYYYTNYHCFDFVKQCELEMLKLIKRDTLIYVSSSQFHGKYEELHGKLTKINDSIYFVEPFKHFKQTGNGDRPLRIVKDSVFFYCDSSLINSNLRIEYLNGKKEKYQIYSTDNKFWVNEEYFNKDNERIYLSFDYKNPIVDETVEIVSKYNSQKYSINFRAVKASDNFYIVVNDNHIKTLN